MAWQADGSDRVTVSGSRVSHSGSEGGGEKKGNALWSNGGSGSWEFKISGPHGAWVGVATADHFGPGYQLKGLLYGGPGNLSDGSALVTGHWGPSFGEGDTIGMRVEQTAGQQARVAFAKNGVGLGTAFDIAPWTGGDLRPVVSINTKGQGIEILEKGSTPPAGLESFTPDVPPPTGVEGSWSGPYQLAVTQSGPATWNLAAKVGNSLRCTVEERADKSLAVGPVAATKMMPPPHLRETEREAGILLAGLTGMRREGSSLVLEGAGGRRAVFKPAPGPGPANRDSIHWIKS